MRKLLAVTLLSLLQPAAMAGADWPMFQHNAARTGQQDRPAIHQPRLLWKAPIGIAGWLNSPVIADHKVFVGSGGYLWNRPDADAYADRRPDGTFFGTDGVYAFDLDSGRQLWKTPAGNDVNNVVWIDERVIATGDEGAIWALDPDTGRQLWRTELKGAGYQLLPLEHQVIVGDAMGQLAWIDVATGRLTNRQRLDGAIRAGAAADGQRIYVATTRGMVYAFDHQGRQQWKQSLGELMPDLSVSAGALEVYGALTLYQDSLIVPFSRDTYYETPALIALATADGAQRWQASHDEQKVFWGNIRTSPAVFRNLLIYAEPYSNTVAAVDAKQGKAAGTLDRGAPMFPAWASPAIAGQTAYVPRFDGGLYAIDAANGEPLWDFYLGIPEHTGALPAGLAQASDTEWKPPIGDAIYASPALAANGRILIPAAGYLYCIGEK